MKYTEQDLKDEYEQAVKRKGKLYAEGYVEGLKDGQNQALSIPRVIKRACSNCVKFMKNQRAIYKHEKYFCNRTPQYNITDPENYQCNKWVEKYVC